MKTPKRKGVVFTDHAVVRMRERGIHRDCVLQVVGSPDTWKPGTDPELEVYRKRFDDGRVIDVVFKYEDGYLVIVTAILRDGTAA